MCASAAAAYAAVAKRKGTLFVSSCVAMLMRAQEHMQADVSHLF